MMDELTMNTGAVRQSASSSGCCSPNIETGADVCFKHLTTVNIKFPSVKILNFEIEIS